MSFGVQLAVSIAVAAPAGALAAAAMTLVSRWSHRRDARACYDRGAIR